MFPSKMIWGSVLIATIADFIAYKYYPQGGSRVSWVSNQVKYNLMKVKNVSHNLADVFCNKPEECKKAADQFFVNVGNIPYDFVEKIAQFVKKSPSQSDDAVRKQQRAAKINVADYTKDEAAHQGNPLKAEKMIKSLRFSSYEENNLCDLKEGIPPGEYDATVDEIADLANMPKKLKKVIKLAKNLTEGKVLAVDRLQFKTEDGKMVFGRVSVVRRREVLDMAYSLQCVKYKLKSKQRQPENAEKLQQFSDSRDDGSDKDEALDKISFDLRGDFLEFFHKQAIQWFIKHCDLKDEDRD